MSPCKSISIIIPTFNEEHSIISTVNETINTLKDNNIVGEIIVVDDGSTDNTNLYSRSIPNITVLTHPHNIGYGKALKTGITAAKFPIIAIIDADGTYPPSLLPKLLDKLNDGFNMVVGARKGSNYKGSAIKWQMRYLLRFLVEWTTGKRIPDINSGMRIFYKNEIIRFFPRLCNTFSFTTSATLCYMMNDLFVSYVSINYEKRIGKSHVKIWRDSLRTLQFILQAIAYYNPLKLFLLLSILVLIFALVSLIIGLIFKITIAYFMSALAISVSIIVFALGIIAELLRHSDS